MNAVYKWKYHVEVLVKCRGLMENICRSWMQLSKASWRNSWRNSSGLLIDIIKSSFVKTKTKNLLVLTVSCVLVNTLHQNDGTWSLLLFRRFLNYLKWLKTVFMKLSSYCHWATTFRDRLGWFLDHVWWLVYPDEVFLESWMIWSNTWLRCMSGCTNHHMSSRDQPSRPRNVVAQYE